MADEVPFSALKRDVQVMAAVVGGKRPQTDKSLHSIMRMHNELHAIMTACWRHEPFSRPSAEQLKSSLSSIKPRGETLLNGDICLTDANDPCPPPTMYKFTISNCFRRRFSF